ncbi:hypothetical protein MVEN_00940500 [Mycena venus]|uniref:Uncharacterized protein n=1 Tax=Mycena venus TaxID=2733690 RepID=A0A8H6YD27_9AGAR|nr:hypothetical protein MVEN_00940500 [Mycena venus]
MENDASPPENDVLARLQTQEFRTLDLEAEIAVLQLKIMHNLEDIAAAQAEKNKYKARWERSERKLSEVRGKYEGLKRWICAGAAGPPSANSNVKGPGDARVEKCPADKMSSPTITKLPDPITCKVSSSSADERCPKLDPKLRVATNCTPLPPPPPLPPSLSASSSGRASSPSESLSPMCMSPTESSGCLLPMDPNPNLNPSSTCTPTAESVRKHFPVPTPSASLPSSTYTPTPAPPSTATSTPRVPHPCRPTRTCTSTPLPTPHHSRPARTAPLRLRVRFRGSGGGVGGGSMGMGSAGGSSWRLPLPGAR